MTAAYNTYFLLVWGPVVLGLLASPLLLGYAIAWSIPHGHGEANSSAAGDDDEDTHAHLQRAAIVYSVAGVAILAFVSLIMHGPRVLVRAGAFPALCRGDITPTTEEELTTGIALQYERHGKPPSIVGSAWGFFIKRYGPPAPRVFTHNFKGPQEANPKRWKAGTTIWAYTLEIKKQNLALQTYPTMDFISLGAWFSMGNHGNGGAASGKSSDHLKNARVLDMKTNTIDQIEYKEVRRRFDAEYERIRKDPASAEPCRYLIIDVEFKNLIKNEDVQKKGIIVDSPESAADWLDPTSYLRVMFQGAARDYSIGVLWLPIYDPDVNHRDPHCCSRFCMYTQLDNLSVTGGCHEPMSKFNGITSRFNANHWMPLIWPFETLFVVIGGFRNFEIFFKLPRALDGATLYKLSRSCIDMHHKIGGRSEIRHGAPDGAICLDCALRGGFDEPFKMLKREFGVTRVALHLGKFTDLPTAPCKRVAVGEL